MFGVEGGLPTQRGHWEVAKGGAQPALGADGFSSMQIHTAAARDTTQLKVCPLFAASLRPPISTGAIGPAGSESRLPFPEATPPSRLCAQGPL